MKKVIVLTLAIAGVLLTANLSSALITPEPTINPPTIVDQCRYCGWVNFTDFAGTPFKNQGDCVSFVSTAYTNLADGSIITPQGTILRPSCF